MMFMIPTLTHRPPLSLELSTADTLVRLIKPRAIGAASAHGMAGRHLPSIVRVPVRDRAVDRPDFVQPRADSAPDKTVVIAAQRCLPPLPDLAAVVFAALRAVPFLPGRGRPAADAPLSIEHWQEGALQ